MPPRTARREGRGGAAVIAGLLGGATGGDHQPQDGTAPDRVRGGAVDPASLVAAGEPGAPLPGSGARGTPASEDGFAGTTGTGSRVAPSGDGSSTRPGRAGPVDAGVTIPGWHRAHSRFTALRSAYAAYECDPMEVLRLPALADVSVGSTARFVDAFAEAQALQTDHHPASEHAVAFAVAVDRAERAWAAAREAAERIRLSGLSRAERVTVERVIKLLTTARRSDSGPERLAAYARARAELNKLDRAGVIHLPRTAAAALESAARGELPA